MPVFGEYETVGPPHATTSAQRYEATVWRVRKSGGPDNQKKLALKCIAPQLYQSGERESETKLAPDGRLEFVGVFKQIKQAQNAGGRGFAPLHDFGTSPEGAWYVTDFYERSSLKTFVTGKGSVDDAALRHVVFSVVMGCLALKRASARAHGNLKPSNVLLGGRNQPLRKTPLLLVDPLPAPAGAGGQNVFEVQDLKSLGELLLQLVEGRLIESVYDYNYPIEPASAWERLGKEGEAWRKLCNQLLDPHLSLEQVNLDSLAREFQPKSNGRNLLIVGGVLVGVGLVGGGIYFRSHSAPPVVIPETPRATADNSGAVQAQYQAAMQKCRAALNPQTPDFDEALKQANIALGLIPNDPEATAALAQATAGKQNAAAGEQFAAALAAGTTALAEKRFEDASREAKAALAIKAGDPAALDLQTKAQQGLAAAQATKATEAEYLAALTAAKLALADKKYEDATLQARTALAIKPEDPAALDLQTKAQQGLAAAQATKASEAEYVAALTAAKLALTDKKYDDAILQAQAALAIKPGDQLALNIQAAAQNAQGVAEQERKYQASLGAAKAALAAHQYEEAMTQAQAALAIKPGDQPALDLQTAAEQGRGVAQREQEYQAALNAARAALADNKFDEARRQITAALAVKPGDETATHLQTEVEQAQKAAETERNYQNAMAAGKKALRDNDFDEAINHAGLALADKPSDGDANSLLTQARAGKQAAATEAKYAAAMAAARAALLAHKYDDAMDKANLALSCKPNDGDASTLLTQANSEKLAVATEGKYQAAMAAATAAFQAQNYEEAVRQAKIALDIKPNDAEATALLTRSQTAKKASDEKSNYATAMQQGQSALDNHDDATAISQANAALAIMPDDPAALKLRQQAQAEQGQQAVLSSVQAKFNTGDYSFTNDPAFLNLTNQPAFGALLGQAVGEAAEAAQLTGYMQQKDWNKVNSGLAGLPAGTLQKQNFSALQKWRDENDPARRLDHTLHQLNAVFTRYIDKKYAREPGFPSLDADNAKFFGQPISMDLMQDANNRSVYLKMLANFKSQNAAALDAPRLKNIDDLAKIINGWNPGNN